MPSIAFYTLGCKVNQYETEVMREMCIRDRDVWIQVDLGSVQKVDTLLMATYNGNARCLYFKILPVSYTHLIVSARFMAF